MEYVLYDLFHHPPMQACLAGGNHPVRQHRGSHTLYIIRNNIETPMYGRVCLGGTIKSKGTTRADTQLDPAVIARSSHQFDNIAFNRWLDAHTANHALQYFQLLRGKHRLELL